MTRFLLVRHATCDPVGVAVAGRAPGISLNARGRAEASRVARRLASAPIDAVYTSPLERARETAEAIAHPHALVVCDSDAFTDVDFGDWTGWTLASLDGENRWRQFNTFRSGVRPPGGELAAEVQVRAVRALDHLRCTHPSGTVAVVSHADVIRAVLAYYLGMPLDFVLRLEISPASVSTLELDDWCARITGVNDVGG